MNDKSKEKALKRKGGKPETSKTRKVFLLSVIGLTLLAVGFTVIDNYVLAESKPAPIKSIQTETAPAQPVMDVVAYPQLIQSEHIKPAPVAVQEAQAGYLLSEDSKKLLDAYKEVELYTMQKKALEAKKEYEALSKPHKVTKNPPVKAAPKKTKPTVKKSYTLHRIKVRSIVSTSRSAKAWVELDNNKFPVKVGSRVMDVVIVSITAKTVVMKADSGQVQTKFVERPPMRNQQSSDNGDVSNVR